MDRVHGAGSLAFVALFVCATGTTAQGSLDWLTGTWTERRHTKDQIILPASMTIAIADSLLRIVDGESDGNDWRCRLDGTETRSRQVTSKATFDYAIKCKVTSQSVQIRGRYLGTMPGAPPLEYEVRKDFELTKSGTLRIRLQIWSTVKELDHIPMFDERVEYARIP